MVKNEMDRSFTAFNHFFVLAESFQAFFNHYYKIVVAFFYVQLFHI